MVATHGAVFGFGRFRRELSTPAKALKRAGNCLAENWLRKSTVARKDQR
jgi:hypothetical protein